MHTNPPAAHTHALAPPVLPSADLLAACDLPLELQSPGMHTAAAQPHTQPSGPIGAGKGEAREGCSSGSCSWPCRSGVTAALTGELAMLASGMGLRGSLPSRARTAGGGCPAGPVSICCGKHLSMSVCCQREWFVAWVGSVHSLECHCFSSSLLYRQNKIPPLAQDLSSKLQSMIASSPANNSLNGV